MEPQGTVLPVYFVADESGSMLNQIGELNNGLASLQDAMQTESFAAAKVRFSVIGFSDVARTYLEPADLRSLPTMPTLQAGGMTSYAAAFNELARRISLDVPALKAQGYAVNRPSVFFLTDGQPNPGDDWRTARTSLLSQHAAPNILAFGIGESVAATIIEIATKPHYAFKSDDGIDPGIAISEFITSLTQSVIQSGQALATGASELQMEKPEGFSLAVDIL